MAIAINTLANKLIMIKYDSSNGKIFGINIAGLTVKAMFVLIKLPINEVALLMMLMELR